MSGTAWLIFLFVAVPLIGLVVWLLLDESLFRVGPGKLGLLVIRGRATDKTLLPGAHFVPAFRRMDVLEYPSIELSYRCGSGDEAGGGDAADVERRGAAVSVVLGDRAEATCSYTVRFRLVPAQLRSVHERFGPDGIWSAVKDLSAEAVATAANDDSVGVDDGFGDGRHALQRRLGAAVTDALAAAGLEVTLFSLTDVDLGATGDTVQATVRARLEVQRADAEAAVRRAQVRHDADLHSMLTGDPSTVALRYRELDTWIEVARLLAGRDPSLPSAVRPPSAHALGDPASPPSPQAVRLDAADDVAADS